MNKTENITLDLSHDELLEVTQSSLSALLRNDSLLRDLPEDIIVEEIKSQVMFNVKLGSRLPADLSLCMSVFETISSLPTYPSLRSNPSSNHQNPFNRLIYFQIYNIGMKS